MTGRGGQSGFTLIEALVALLVVGIVLTAVVPAVGRAGLAQQRVEERTFAEWVALNVLADLRTAPEPPPPGERHGFETMAGRDWPWAARITAEDGAPLAPVVVTVSDPAGGAPVATLTGYVERR